MTYLGIQDRISQSKHWSKGLSDRLGFCKIDAQTSPMQSTMSYLIRLFLACVLFGSSFHPSAYAQSADEIKLKSGQVISGRITYEADDIVKIEVSISASIKETKILSRADIELITKQAPDQVAYLDLQKILPVGSLQPASAYKSLIEKGPASFLRQFPTSSLVPKVEEIQKTLAEELDKVERGYLKIEGEWITPEDKISFPAQVESKIRLVRMKSLASGSGANGLIAAMREFEAIEENYYGTPAFADALELALQIVPSLGNQLNGMNRDVEYRNTEFETNKAALKEDARLQIEAARAKEEADYEAGLAADKKAGIKWVRLEPRSKTSIESYLKLASTEYERIKAYDPAALKTQAAQLVEVDQAIASGNYDVAGQKLAAASALSGKKADTKSKGKSSSKTSYITHLRTKLTEQVAAKTAAAKAAADAAKSEALTAGLIKQQESNSPEIKVATEPAADGSAPAEAATVTAGDLFSALSTNQPAKPAAETAPPKKQPKPSSSASPAKPKPSAKDDAGEDEEEEKVERPRPVPVEESGGFSFGLVVPILTVVLILAIVLLKVLGIGGKKSDE